MKWLSGIRRRYRVLCFRGALHHTIKIRQSEYSNPLYIQWYCTKPSHHALSVMWQLVTVFSTAWHIMKYPTNNLYFLGIFKSL